MMCNLANGKVRVSGLLFLGMLLMGLFSGLSVPAAGFPTFTEVKTFLTGPDELFVWNKKCYFAAALGAASDVELYVSDGTSAGTERIKDIRAGVEGSFPKGFIYGPNRGYIYFIADDGISGEEVWALNPAGAAPWLFVDLNKINRVIIPGVLYGTEGGNPRYLAPLNEKPADYSGFDFCCAADYSMTGDGPSQNEFVEVNGLKSTMSDIRSGAQGSNPRDISVGRRYNPGDPDYGSYKGWWSAFFFSADDGTKGREFVRYSLFREDWGVTIVDIRPGAESSNPSNFTSSGNNMFFTANNGADGAELWIDTGYGGSVSMLKDIQPGSSGSSPGSLVSPGNGSIFFTAFNETSGRELWKSDGTAAGTILVRDIVSDTGSSFPDHLCIVGGTLYFAADDGFNGTELWKSDGTSGGTAMVKNIRSKSAGSNPQHLTAMGGKCYFTCDSNGDGRREFWVSDGTSDGTIMLMNWPKEGANPRQLTAGGSLLFLTVDNTLYMYDPAGTPPPAAPSNLRFTNQLSQLRENRLYFEWDDNSSDEDNFTLYFGQGPDAPPRFGENQNSGTTDFTVGPGYSPYITLLPNTPYSFSVRSLRSPVSGTSFSLWPDPPYITAWTLPPVPENISPNWPEGVWTMNNTIEFSDLTGLWGEGGVSRYRYVWNTSSSWHTFTGTEAIWDTGYLNLTVPASGQYFLNLQSLNEVNVPNPYTLRMGPFLFDLEAPDAPPILTGMIPAENQVIFNWSIPSDPGGSGIDSYDCQIGTIAGSSNVFNGNVGANPYKIASHIPSGKTSYYARVRAVDVAGNVGPWSANSSPVAANAAPTDLKSATIAHILGRATLDTELRFHAELNGDGQISIEDLILLINDGL